MSTWHVGRSWPPDTFIEDACPCPKTPCGLVDQGNTSPDCDQHHVGNGHYARTIRQGHKPEDCPGPSVEQDLAAAERHVHHTEEPAPDARCPAAAATALSLLVMGWRPEPHAGHVWTSEPNRWCPGDETR